MKPSRGRGLRMLAVLGCAVVAAGVALAAVLPDGGAVDTLTAAKIAFADGKYAKAEQLLRAYRADDVPARVLLGRVLLARGRASEACELFTALTKADARNVAALRGLAESHDELRQDDLACVAWQRVVHAQKDDASAWRGLALAQIRRGDSMSALSTIQRALELDPGQSDLSTLMTEIAAGQAFPPSGSHTQFDGLYPRPNNRPPIGPERPDPLKSVGGRR